jgi:hypothetical protein
MRKRPDDIVVAREILTRQRRMGQPFGVAWARALDALPPPPVDRQRSAAGVEREQARRALEATREQWEQAYQRRPPPGHDRHAAAESSR